MLGCCLRCPVFHLAFSHGEEMSVKKPKKGAGVPPAQVTAMQEVSERIEDRKSPDVPMKPAAAESLSEQRYSRSSMWAQWAVVVATLLYAVFAGAQWWAIRQTNVLAERQLRLAATVQNPRLEIVSVAPVPPPLQLGRMDTDVWIRNVGATPATNIMVYTMLEVLPARVSDLVHPIPEDAHLERLDPGETYRWGAISNLITPEWFRTTNADMAGATLRVELVYHNSVGEKLRRLDCREWSRVDGQFGPCLYLSSGVGMFLQEPPPGNSAKR